MERATASEDWLWFLEAADEMGVPRPSTRSWLENLAKAHGVRIGDAWGLDWQIPMLRPDAISPELTARFARIAKLLEHPAAERFAEQNLSGFSAQKVFPAVVTSSPAVRPLRAGEDTILFPLTNQQLPGRASLPPRLSWRRIASRMGSAQDGAEAADQVGQ